MTNIREIVEKRIALEIFVRHGSFDKDSSESVTISCNGQCNSVPINISELNDAYGVMELIAHAESLGIPEAQPDRIEAEYRRELEMRRKAWLHEYQPRKCHITTRGVLWYVYYDQTDWNAGEFEGKGDSEFSATVAMIRKLIKFKQDDHKLWVERQKNFDLSLDLARALGLIEDGEVIK